MSDLRGTLQDAARGSALSQPKVFVLVTPPPPTSPRDKPPPDVASMMARHHVPLMEDTLARLCVNMSPSAYPEAQGSPPTARVYRYSVPGPGVPYRLGATSRDLSPDVRGRRRLPRPHRHPGGAAAGAPWRDAPLRGRPARGGARRGAGPAAVLGGALSLRVVTCPAAGGGG
eukprot:scaffold55381_cov45-Phaeocystis_antarctica.AAC.1